MKTKEPTDRVRSHIRKATELLADGKTPTEAASELGFTTATLHYWRREYPDLWQKYLAAAGGMPKAPGEVRRPTRTPVTPKVRARIIEATRLFARGLSLTEVADALDMKPGALADYRQSHRQLWKMAEDQADQFAAELVKAQAGTDAMLADPARYLAMAGRAEKWARKHGQELFPSNGEMTMVDFYHRWYVKECMAPDASAAYRDQFERALRRWTLVTGNPPLSDITNDLLRRYRDFLTEARGQQPGTKASPATVNSNLVYILRLLRKAGPQGFRNIDAAGLVNRVPWVKRHREPQQVPRIVDEWAIEAVYKKAGVMVVPQIPGVEPAAWWRALLVTAWNTGLRRRTLFALKWSWLDPTRRRFVAPPEAMKSARGHIVHLPAVVVDHLEAIRTARELVFPWPYDLTHLSRSLHRLQYDAGIPTADHFTLHTIRRTLATRLWRENPQAAALALGHTQDRVTREHYVRGPGIVADAVDALRQPDAFRRDLDAHKGGPNKDDQAA